MLELWLDISNRQPRRHLARSAPPLLPLALLCPLHDMSSLVHIPNPLQLPPAHDNLNDFIPDTVRNQYRDLERRMCEQFGWTQSRRFQVDGALLQLARRDAMIHVGTGQGKTAIAAAPYVLEENNQKITIFISPLIVLQSEMVR
jgi:superfamily II DNA helicase RecQ